MTDDVRVKAAERGQVSGDRRAATAMAVMEAARYGRVAGGRPVSVRRPVITVATVMAVMAALFVTAWLAASGGSGLGHLVLAIGCLAAVTGLVCVVVAVSMRQLTRPVKEVRDR
jgi:hypothetical protein